MTGDARKAAEIFLGRKTQAQPRVSLPGRLERRGRELWDGAHTPAGTAWLRERIDEPVEVVVASILADKDADAMLHDLAALTPRLVATTSDNPRALPAEQLAREPRRTSRVEIEPDPHRALARARQSSTGLILVTGSLYLLANLAKAEEQDVR